MSAFGRGTRIRTILGHGQIMSAFGRGTGEAGAVDRGAWNPTAGGVALSDRCGSRCRELGCRHRGAACCEPQYTTVVDRRLVVAIRAYDSDSSWRGIDVVFAIATNAGDVQRRAIRATASR